MPENLSNFSYYGLQTTLIPDTALEGYEKTICQQDKEGVSYFEGIALMMGTIIGVMNMVVVMVIARGGQKLRKPTFLCICNLAMADMLAGLLLLWIFGLQKIILPFRTPISELIQKSFWAMTVWSSILSQVVIAADRFLCVTRRKKGSETSFRLKRFIWEEPLRRNCVRTGIILTWLFPILTFVVPVITTWNCSSSCNCYKPTNNTANVYYMFCTPLRFCSLTNPPFTKASMLYLSLSLLLMPIIPCVLYFQIFRHVNVSANKCKAANSHPSLSSDSVDDRSRSHSSGSGNSQQKAVVPVNNRLTRVMSLSPPSSMEDEKNNSAEYACEMLCLESPQNEKEEKKPSSQQNFILARFCKRKDQPTNKEPAPNRIRLRHLLSVNGTFTRTLARLQRKRELRLLRTLLIILATLLISTVPLGMLFLISFGETDKRYVVAAKYLLTSSLINSLVNPWIYFWRFVEMRSALKKMFC